MGSLTWVVGGGGHLAAHLSRKGPPLPPLEACAPSPLAPLPALSHPQAAFSSHLWQANLMSVAQRRELGLKVQNIHLHKPYTTYRAL